ncbi:MAG: histidine kinase [Cyanobacteria bacterium RYN_339]|nr:histidine kinase [Cyanobacteria bacterium RYN_339]
MRPKAPSVAPPIIWGVLLILATIVLTVFWNVAIVSDWFRQTMATSRPLFWTLLIGGLVLFTTVITGLVLFIVSLARQIVLNRRQQNFIDSVTHELKSPLTSLKLHLQTMEMRELEPAVRQEFTRLMLADVERLDALIDHVLEAAHMDTRLRRQELQDVELGPQLEAAIAIIRRRHQLPPEAIALDAHPVRVRTDPASLEIVLLNLLENAVKYSREEVRVGVRAFRAGEGEVAVAISDAGVGIPQNQLKRVFHRFHRVGNELTRIRTGTGLGLYIVKETLRGLGGRVEAFSAGENQGSVFTLTLPEAKHG